MSHRSFGHVTSIFFTSRQSNFPSRDAFGW
uniref:Uncharacterized protein n=1 Tax=Arundo donax TaxID=35708 RepID=A0A0A9C5C4_ARUDO